MPNKPMIVKILKRVASFLAAFAAGLLNGLFGGGGGMLVVPALTRFSSLDERSAHATAIAVILPLSVLSSVTYILGGTCSFYHALYVGVGVVLGGALGAAALKGIPKGALTLSFYGIMIYAGVRMVLS